MLRFHTQTAGCSLTAQQPENNIIRTTLEALAAVLGGTQSLHTNSYDEAYATPTEKAVMIALRTQQIIAYESGAVNTIDPLAGSYFVERLTDEIEEQAMKYIERIQSMGEGEYPMLKGVIKGIETGFFQKEISDAAYTYQREIESDARIVVGVNKLKMEEERLKKTLRVDEAVQRAQIERLKKLRVKRDRRKVQDALEKLRKAAEGNQNLMYPMMKCAGAYATIGEICDVMRQVFGEYQERTIF
jgi:methylmalonyl-CoA mutase N-terminal domain/subunit